MKPASQIILFSALLVFLFGCKKYPENNLWFKNPEKLTPFNGYLKVYKVNGIDSLNKLNLYLNHQANNEVDIVNCKIRSSITRGRVTTTWVFSELGALEIFYFFNEKKSSITITQEYDTNIIKKNIFLDKNISWNIEQLGRNKEFKISTQLQNGNKYEITID